MSYTRTTQVRLQLLASFFFASFILTVPSTVAAQQTDTTTKEMSPVKPATNSSVSPLENPDAVFTKAERPAEFPGGLKGWQQYLQENLKYPKKANKKGTQGEVKIRMTVLKDGSVGKDLVVMRDPGDGLAEEAIRVILKGPKWIPAQQKGRLVTYRFIQTVTFMLQ